MPTERGSGGSRDAIMDAAEALMADLGFDRTSISAICRRSGLPVGSVYHHFSDKAALLQAVLQRGAARFAADLPEPGRPGSSPERDMRVQYAAAAGAIVAHARYFSLATETARFGLGEPAAVAVIEQVGAEAWRRLCSFIEPYVVAMRVPDASALSARLADLTITFTRGAIVEAAGDQARLQVLMSDLYEALQAMIVLRSPTRE